MARWQGWIVVALLLASSPAAAELIRGRVGTTRGEPLLGATLTAEGPTLHEQVTAISEDDGGFTMEVPPGVYVVTAYYGDLLVAKRDVAVARHANTVIELELDTTAPDKPVVLMIQDPHSITCCAGESCTSRPRPTVIPVRRAQSAPGCGRCDAAGDDGLVVWPLAVALVLGRRRVRKFWNRASSPRCDGLRTFVAPGIRSRGAHLRGSAWVSRGRTRPEVRRSQRPHIV